MPLTLLVIDDDAVDREVVRRTLRAARIEATVLEASTAEEGLAILRDGAVDCLLLDFYLPGSDGLTVLRQLADEELDVPAIALTGQGDEQTAVALMKAGAVDYLSKQAMTADRLERSIRHALTVAAAERERRELLARERAAREEAQLANRAKDEFLAALSHELRTPLNSILGWSRLLATSPLEPGAIRRGLETIERNARLQVKLIDDLLDISRIVTGKLTLESQAVSLSLLVISAVDSQQPAATAAGVTLRHAVLGEERHVLGDSARLQQVITNLLSNALKFTPAGGVVDVSLAFGDDQAHLTITDSGIGIDPAFLPFVFERFRQADGSPTRRHSGLGLGLAIVRHLVELHGGRVEIESAGLGHGTTCRVWLPMVPAPVRADVDDEPADTTTLVGLSVLAVDDDADSLELLTALLRRCGAVVYPATNTIDALALAREHRPDVVLSDVAMPGRDGYSLIKDIRRLWPEHVTAAAAITAFAAPEDRARALDAGFQIHVAKPFEPSRLIRTVVTLARNRSAAVTPHS